MSQPKSANLDYLACCRTYLEELLGRKDYRAAGRYFGTIEAEISGCPGTTLGIILTLAARAFNASGESKKGLPLARKAVDLLGRVAGDVDDTARAFLALGDALREQGQFPLAVRAFRDAESIFRRRDNAPGRIDALNRLAGIYFRETRYALSLEVLLEAAEVARVENLQKKLVILFGNIGRLYSLMGKLESAKEYLKLCDELCQQMGDLRESLRARLSRGYVLMQQTHFAEAARIFDEIQPQLGRQEMVKDAIIAQTYQGELAVRTGQTEAASVILHDAHEKAVRLGPESALVVSVLRWLAETMAAIRDFRRCLAYVNQALPAAGKLNDKVEESALLRLKAMCLEQMKNDTPAREAYESALALLDETGARLALAECLVAAGRSRLFASAQKTMFICRAEEIYRRCQVVFKADEILAAFHEAVPSGTVKASNPPKSGVNGPVSQNKKMQKILAQLRLLHTVDIPLLFTGETGVGKDYLARYFHSLARPGRPLVIVNCAAIPENLIEAELFGHDRGAYTGAETTRKGLFEAADKGVILLDEIGELPLSMQAKLLTVLETRKLRPLGTTREIELDILFLAATNRDLAEMVRGGTFRQDLFYRLAGISIEVPPLRDRKEDIPSLLDYFMRRYGLLTNGSGPDPDLIRQFVAYDWPGNIRQMENRVRQLEALSVLGQDRPLAELARRLFDDNLPERTLSLFEEVELLETRLLREALISTGGNKSEAARILSIHESTFRAKMKRYQLEGLVN